MKTLTVGHEGGVTRVELNRPAVRNAFNAELIAELTLVFTSLPPATRVVVLSGAGKAFCAGADLDWMTGSVAYSRQENQADAERLADMLRAVDDAPAVVIGRVHGAALGGGVGLVSCCDVVVATADCKLGLTEVRLGLVPAVISPYVLRKIGPSAARRYFATGEIFDAARALAMGLVHEVVASEAELDAVVAGLALAVQKNGPQAVREAKLLVRDVPGLSATEARQHTAAVIARLRVSPEGQEGLRAFLEKRDPVWP